MSGGGGGGGGGGGYCVPVHYSFARSLLSALYCHGYIANLVHGGGGGGGGGDCLPCPVTTALHGHMAAYIYMWRPCNYSCMLRITMR